MFIDQAKIHVRSGHGGNGCISFRREKFIPKGGPDGGNGGAGGDVVFKIDQNLRTLLDFRYKRYFSAQNGRPGEGGNRTGARGEGVTIYVPQGTVVINDKTNEIIADLVSLDQEIIIAQGGRGGRGNASYATSTNQTPRFAKDGQPGEEVRIRLELKILADVGLVGFPNVGKSTFLARVSKAKPKIADYPFTTVVPNLGIVQTKDFQSFVIADIPGLLAGAHAGKGLGLQFLRHIERTKLLLFLVDATRDSIQEDVDVLKKELRLYDNNLLKKPSLIAVTKIDLIEEEKRSSYQPFPISSITGQGVQPLLQAIHDMLKDIT